MDFEIIKEVTNILTDIQKYIDVENFLIMNNDEQNILAGLHYDKFEISEKDKLKYKQMKNTEMFTSLRVCFLLKMWILKR